MCLVRRLQQVLIRGLLVFFVLLACCFVAFLGVVCFWFLLAPATESWLGGFYCKLPRGSDFLLL